MTLTATATAHQSLSGNRNAPSWLMAKSDSGKQPSRTRRERLSPSDDTVSRRVETAHAVAEVDVAQTLLEDVILGACVLNRVGEARLRESSGPSRPLALRQLVGKHIPRELHRQRRITGAQLTIPTNGRLTSPLVLSCSAPPDVHRSLALERRGNPHTQQ